MLTKEEFIIEVKNAMHGNGHGNITDAEIDKYIEADEFKWVEYAYEKYVSEIEEGSSYALKHALNQVTSCMEMDI